MTLPIRLFLASVLAVAVAPASAQGVMKSSVGNDFTGNTQITTMASQMHDETCESLYDSASPAAMLVEVGGLVAKVAVASKLGEVTGKGGPDATQIDQIRTALRELAKRKVWLPIALEDQLGDMMHSSKLEHGEVLDPGTLNRKDRKRFDRIKEILAELVGNLPADNPYQFRLGVSTLDVWNAEANPGGYIYVSQPLLRDNSVSDDEIAMALAHEISHVTKRHALRMYQVRLVDSLKLLDLVKQMPETKSNPLQLFAALMAAQKTGEKLFLQFDHTQEFEADACGIQLATLDQKVNVGRGIKEFSKRSQQKSAKTWSDSHPSDPQRQVIMGRQYERMRGMDRAKLVRASYQNTLSGAPAVGEASGGSNGEGVQAGIGSALNSLGGLFSSSAKGDAVPTPPRASAAAPSDSAAAPAKGSFFGALGNVFGGAGNPAKDAAATATH